MKKDTTEPLTEENEEEKNGISFGDILFAAGMVIVFAAFAFYAFMQGTDRSLYLFGKVFDCYTVSFIAIFFMDLIYIFVAKSRKKEDGSVKLFPVIVLTADLILIGALIIAGFVRGAKNCRVSEKITLEDGRTVYLTETDQYNKQTDIAKAYISVYQIKGITAKPLGEIDETFFLNSCLEDDEYAYTYDPDEKTFELELAYGKFGDDIVSLKPEYDTGSLKYTFKLK